MKKDSLTTRYAGIATDETDTETYGRQVTIQLVSIAPNIIVTKDGSYDNIIPLFTENTTVLANNKNILVDSENIDRFIFIASVSSSLTDNVIHVYYDDVYKDMFVIPSLNSVGIDDDVKLYENSGVVVTGYRLFGRGTDGVYVDDLSLPIKGDNVFKLTDKPARLTTTTAFTVDSSLAISNTGIDMVGTRLISEEIIYDKSRLPVGYIDLGTVSDVFGEDIPLPTFNTLDTGVGISKLDYLGMVKGRRLIFPIMF